MDHFTDSGDFVTVHNFAIFTVFFVPWQFGNLFRCINFLTFFLLPFHIFRNMSESNSCASLPRTGVSDSETVEGSIKPKRKKRRKKTVKSNLSRRQVEITKNLFYVLCAFLVCITPYLILLVFNDDGPLAAFAPYAAACLMVNNCINWIIYATKHPHFKVVFKCILTCKWREIPEPVGWLRDRGDGNKLCPCCWIFMTLETKPKNQYNAQNICW